MVLEIENLSFSFIGSENPALKDINLRIGKGEFVAILGPNGSGKTTLGLCMTGIIPHFSQGIFQGRVTINNKDTSEYKIHDIARDVGILMQDYESQIFFPTIEDEIRFQLDNFGLPSDGRITEISDELHISGLLKRNLFELSEGEKQKTLIASILSIDPDVLILDEPTSQLDSKERNNLLKTLKHLNKRGKTIIMITHDTHVARHCSRFVVICGGSIVKDTCEGSFLEENSNTSWGIEPVKHKWGEGNSCKKSAETKPLISIKHLTYEIINPVLEDVNVEIRDGEFIMILGSNGSGKTTLVKHLIKLLKVQEGAILLKGKHLRQHSQADIARMIGFIFQNPEHQIFRNTVEEEIKFTLEILKEENVAEDIKAVLKD
ncbi:MAG: ABC transporter ATP-binding protein, partial [Candidatus Altiarchaeales archaeon]|nr:ABC transporter ATP-binding protein [Candidatus Altiarchaeales archaeon]